MSRSRMSTCSGVSRSANGRTGCDFIRGWLDYCIALHDRVLDERPDLLVPGG